MRFDEQLLKRQLALEFCAIVEGWTLSQVTARTGLNPSRVSELRHGKLAGFSVARLMRMIADFGYDIEVVIRPTRRPIITRQGPTTTVLRYDRFDRAIARPSAPTDRESGTRDLRRTRRPAGP
jgi:predicted XRE-type DNA-binding protein